MLRALALTFLLTGPAAAQDIEALLARSLSQDVLASFWLPDNADPAAATEAVGVVYAPIPGAASSVNIFPGYFKREGESFAFVGEVTELYGGEPRDPRFLADRIELTTTMPRPDDPRSCPTGTARWSIDRATLAARRLE